MGGQGAEEVASVLKGFYDSLCSCSIPRIGLITEVQVFGYLVQVEVPEDLLSNIPQSKQRLLASLGLTLQQQSSTQSQIEIEYLPSQESHKTNQEEEEEEDREGEENIAKQEYAADEGSVRSNTGKEENRVV